MPEPAADIRDSNATIAASAIPAAEAFAQQESPASAPWENPENQEKKKKKFPWIWVIILALLAALGVGGYFAYDNGYLDFVKKWFNNDKSKSTDESDEESSANDEESTDSSASQDEYYDYEDEASAISNDINEPSDDELEPQPITDDVTPKPEPKPEPAPKPQQPAPKPKPQTPKPQTKPQPKPQPKPVENKQPANNAQNNGGDK